MLTNIQTNSDICGILIAVSPFAYPKSSSFKKQKRFASSSVAPETGRNLSDCSHSIKSLCDEISLCVPSGSYHSQTMLVCQENQGPWQMNLECVEQIWLTACKEYVLSTKGGYELETKVRIQGREGTEEVGGKKRGWSDS